MGVQAQYAPTRLAPRYPVNRGLSPPGVAGLYGAVPFRVARNFLEKHGYMRHTFYAVALQGNGNFKLALPEMTWFSRRLHLIVAVTVPVAVTLVAATGWTRVQVWEACFTTGE